MNPRSRKYIRVMTPKELRFYLDDNAEGFDTEMRKRLMRLTWPVQNKLLTVSKLLNHRNWWRSLTGSMSKGLLDKLAGAL